MSSYAVRQYTSLLKSAEVYGWSDHILCVKIGEVLDKSADKLSRLNISSTEELAVGYYRKCVKHEKTEQRLTKASEILLAIENEYKIYQ
jgi:hypothetical protein